VIDSLTSEDHAPFDPSNVRPTVDLSANEAEPQFATEAWPAKVPTLVSLQGAGGTQQSLNLVTGQFFTDSGTGHGVERLWKQLAGRVTYSTSTDFTPPTIDSSDAFLNGGTVVFSGHFGGTTGGVQFAQVVYDVDNSGTWRALRLVDQGGGNWSGGTAFNGSNVQYFVEVCDGAGNCGYSSNKGRYFDAQPLQSSNGTITLAPDRDPGPGGYYTAPLTVTVTSSAPLLSVAALVLAAVGHLRLDAVFAEHGDDAIDVGLALRRVDLAHGYSGSRRIRPSWAVLATRRPSRV